MLRQKSFYAREPTLPRHINSHRVEINRCHEIDSAVKPAPATGIIYGTCPVRFSPNGNGQIHGHLTHPEGITIDAHGTRAYVAVANDDRVAVLDLATHMVVRN